MSDDERTRLAAAEVLGGLYETLIDNTRFEGMAQAMDSFIDTAGSTIETGTAEWRQMFREHFARVGQFLDDPADRFSESPIIYVDRQIVPAAIINRSLKIVAANDLLIELLGEGQESVAELLATPSDRRRLEQLFQANDESTSVMISIEVPGSRSPFFVIASLVELADTASGSGALVSFRLAKATWNPGLVPLLMDAYGLTHAETEVLQGLIEHGTVSEVAETRGRSVRTVRTQLTQVFGKLGLKGQTELALFLATLSQLLSKGKQPSDVGLNWSRNTPGDLEHAQAPFCGRQLAYVRYGRPGGLPVLFCHSTSPPDMTPDFRRTCREMGLRVVGVHKPGSGGASPRPTNHGPEELSADFQHILDLEGISQAVIAGHCSGGLYALRLAADIADRAMGVVLVDTGLPFEGRAELTALPKTARRTFLPARYIPDVLLVPHRIVAANFNRSKDGEARVVDYFFEDSDVDRDLVRTDRTFYEITRRVISYSFEDVPRLVSDVCRWARDWDKLLHLGDHKPMVFVHGRENNIFAASKIEAFAATRPMVSCLIAEGGGQLQVYQNPARFAEACHRISEIASSER